MIKTLAKLQEPLRVRAEYSWVSDQIICTDDEHDGDHMLWPMRLHEMNKQHFIDMDKLLARYKETEVRLVEKLEALRKRPTVLDAAIRKALKSHRDGAYRDMATTLEDALGEE